MSGEEGGGEGGVVVHGASALKRRVKRQPCWSWMRTSERVVWREAAERVVKGGEFVVIKVCVWKRPCWSVEREIGVSDKPVRVRREAGG